ncbi:putative glycosyl hydrolase [Halenospora varia]|nr:putative glycosyl hydrolase [Halenospora varia]
MINNDYTKCERGESKKETIWVSNPKFEKAEIYVAEVNEDGEGSPPRLHKKAKREGSTQHSSPELPISNMSLTGQIESTLTQLTLSEKISLLSGSSFTSATGVPRLNIPTINLLDSINGIKTLNAFNPTPSLCFPSTTCLGSTWNTALLRRMGNTLAGQAMKGACNVILGPTVNINRDPRGGRNFECFSEDPLLTGMLAASLVKGIQEGGVAACLKHFVGNESELKRRFYSVNTSTESRVIREIYLAAFEYVLKEVEPWAIMTAYNKIQDTSSDAAKYCSESTIINRILRKEWSYTGCVLSDWYGTRSSLPALNAGLDLEMPGPSVFRGEALLDLVKTERVFEESINERVKNVLGLILKTTTGNITEEKTEEVKEKENVEGRRLARQVAAEGIILLKNNNNVLPLKRQGLEEKKIAVIGPYALKPPSNGGGSAAALPEYLHAPLNLLRTSLPSSTNIEYELGFTTHQSTPALSPSLTRAKNRQEGMDVQYFIHDSETPVLETFNPSTKLVHIGHVPQPLTQLSFSHYTLSTTLTPLTTGNHTIAIQTTGAFSLYVDDQLVLQDEMTPAPTVEDFLFVPLALERSLTISLRAGQSYAIRAVVKPQKPVHDTGEPLVHATKLCYLEETKTTKLRSDAVELAEQSDTTIIFAGRNEEMESEGFDLTSIKLPLEQELAICSVAKASKKTVLVLYGGNPVDVSPFIDLVDAVVFAHFPGQEGSQALVDILTGVTNPSGRLATSWPKRLEDVPSFEHFPARENEGGEWEMKYVEGLRVGYRGEVEVYEPRWGFGFGLSYTRFEYCGLKCVVAGEGRSGKVIVDVYVENTKDMAGYEVVMVFVEPVAPSVWRPKRELKGFEKVWVEVGEKKVVKVEIDLDVALRFWDDRVRGEECWRVDSGDYKIHIGNLSEKINIGEGFTWKGI